MGRKKKTKKTPDKTAAAPEGRLAALDAPAEANQAEQGLAETQRALLNILDDFNSEKSDLQRTQSATFNILDDFSMEKQRLEQTQRAVLNILDDFDSEKSNLQRTQSATFNILEDFSVEKRRLEETQRATFNVLEDFGAEKLRLEQTQRAVLNILDDLNQSNEGLQAAHSVLELRVEERTAELRKRTEELENANRNLEASNKELESFSYSISHDLRAPLRIMDGFSQAVIEDYEDKLDAEGKRYLKEIRLASQLMARLIDDILNLSRITRVEITMERVNLSNLAREAADEMRRLQPDRQVEVTITPGLEAYGDRYLLKLVFQNLIGNAFKFTGNRELAEIEFGVADRDGRPVYFVRDNGAGFDMTYVAKLFKPFQRLHRAEDFPGTGIGLASVQRIISRMEGSVWGEGETGKGATFYFALRQNLNGEGI